MAEGAPLLREYTGDRIEGSNPSLSDAFLYHAQFYIMHKPSNHATLQFYLMNIHVDDQEKALRFYTSVLGFSLKDDIDMGAHRWLTVVDPNDTNGMQLLLEPNHHPAAMAYQSSLKKDGIAAASFFVSDIDQEYQRLLSAGVVFQQQPITMGGVVMALFDDTCGNFIQLIQRS